MSQQGYSRRRFLRRTGVAAAGVGGAGVAIGPATAEIEALSDNPWARKRVLNIAHRGGTFEAPENTLFAFKRAFAQGAHAIEFDIWETADGELVVHHDETVDRRTDGTGRVTEYTRAELKELDAAYWHIPGIGTCHPSEEEDHSNDGTCPEAPDEDSYEYRGYATGERDIPDDLGDEYGLDDLAPNDFRIPTVEEILAAFPDEYLVLEMKASGFEAKLAALLDEYGRRDDVIVASFEQTPLSSFRDEAPDVPTGGSMWETGGFILWACGELPWPPDLWFEVVPAPLEYAGFDVFSEGIVEGARQTNVAAHAWTVNDRDRLLELVDLGADGIYTDRPTELADVLEETGEGYDGEEREDDDGDEDDSGGDGPGFTLPVVAAAIGGTALASRLRDGE